MIIKPYADIAAETFDAADFPALKHFWPCKQGAVPRYSTLLDVVGDANMYVASIGGATASGNGVVYPAESSVTKNSAGATKTLTPTEYKNCLIIACGLWGADTGSFFYGDGTNGYNVGHSTYGARAILSGSGESVTQTPTPGAYTRGLLITGNGSINTNMQSIEVNASGVATVGALTPTSTSQALSAVSSACGPVNAAETYFGIAFFKFAGAAPSLDVIKAAMAWCDYQWRNSSHIAMYPGFKGLA